MSRVLVTPVTEQVTTLSVAAGMHLMRPEAEIVSLGPHSLLIPVDDEFRVALRDSPQVTDMDVILRERGVDWSHVISPQDDTRHIITRRLSLFLHSGAHIDQQVRLMRFIQAMPSQATDSIVVYGHMADVVAAWRLMEVEGRIEVYCGLLSAARVADSPKLLADCFGHLLKVVYFALGESDRPVILHFDPVLCPANVRNEIWRRISEATALDDVLLHAVGGGLPRRLPLALVVSSGDLLVLGAVVMELNLSQR
ncbi:MAG: uncharacterized protein KVP18_001842 [Porospora cf. gigantea A]|uniref:uncharacterized protein n=1 Tax=Porospora cf. gigantea A TaxID=2853593 RepID=UPI003559AEA2|nr:MAG: hypothetical protein KVP18_001842 [Porospora cf. gigantea A]